MPSKTQIYEKVKRLQDTIDQELIRLYMIESIAKALVRQADKPNNPSCVPIMNRLREALNR
jgi:hypothetical protein